MGETIKAPDEPAPRGGEEDLKIKGGDNQTPREDATREATRRE